MFVEARFSPLPHIFLVLALMGATFCSLSRVTLKTPIPSGFLRRNSALCESIAARTTATPVEISQAARLKMIRERSNDEASPETAVSAPLLSLAPALVPIFGPAGTPHPSPPHLRC
jgi:hypothetical protein